MHRGTFIILITYGSLICPRLAAQQSPNYIFNHIDHANGLLNDAVYAIGQDSTGFIWISSLTTLQRYDGSRFVNYSHYRATDTIHILPSGFEKYTDNNGNSWTIGGRYIYRYDSLAKKRPDRAMIIFPNGKSELVYTLAKDVHHNQIWAATSAYGLLLLDGNTKKIYHHNSNSIHQPVLEKLPMREIRYIMLDSRQNLWICYWSDRFFRFNLLTKKISRYSLSSFKKSRPGSANVSLLVNAIYEDDHASIWVGTENAGLLLYNREQDSFNCISPEERTNQAIQYNYDIYCIFQDREKNLWIGTDKGINIFNPYRQYFTTIRSEPGNPQSLPKHEVMASIETQQGDVLIGTWGGGISVYDHDLKFKKNIFFHRVPELNLIWSFVQKNDGTILIGCQHGYLHIYNPFTGTIETVHPPELQNSTVRCMAKDGRGNILFGLHNGKIAYWKEKEQKFYPYDESIITDRSSFTPVLHIFIDPSQNYWVSTENGFKQFDPQKRIYIRTYFPEIQNGKPVIGITCEGIEEYNDSLLLVGTTGGSLNYFNTNTKAFSPVTTGQDIQFNAIFAIKKDAANNVWFTTDYGLYKMRNGQNKFIACNMEKGIVNSSFQLSRFYVMRDGRWLTSTLTELIGFYPDSLNKQMENQTGVTITGFKVFNKPVFIDSLLHTNSAIQLSYEQNFLNIEFAALNFYNIKETRYYYRLAGVDKDWVDAGTKGFAGYTNLRPGEYSFSVKADNGNQESETTSFKIIIAPPFWLSWWFIGTAVAVTILFLYWIIAKRIKNIRHEAEMKQKVVETEMMALKAQMNPHFIFNCISAIDNLIQTDQKDKATVYLTRFAKLIRAVLDSSKNNVVPFYKDYESLQLFLQLEQFRCSNKFEYCLDVEQEILNSDIKVPPLIIQPFVENAIYHGLMNKPGLNRRLDIKVQLEKDHLRYTITDNGIGRATAEALRKMNKPEHISYGMEISERRVNLHNQNGSHPSVVITDLNDGNIPAGTKVELWLSLK